MAPQKIASSPVNAAARVGNLGANGVFSFTQISGILNDMYEQATGQKQPVALNTSEFVTQADTMMKLGYNKLIPTVSAVLTRTIFSNRPHYPEFGGLVVDSEKWGYMDRKITPYVDKAEDNPEYDIKDGDMAGCWPVKIPKALQTVFMGGGTDMYQIPYYRNQLDTAFRSPDEMARFVASYVQTYKNRMASDASNLGRVTVTNLMGSILNNPGNRQVVHLLTEYNAETGSTLNSTSVMHPDNYVAFALWLNAKIQIILDFMQVESTDFHLNPKGKNIMRHTPRNYARFYMLSQWGRNVENRVNTTIFNAAREQVADFMSVPFWQSPKNPDSINIIPSTVDGEGHTITGSAVQQDNIFGIITDIEAMGMGYINQWVGTTLEDPRLGTWAEFYHFTRKYYNDTTENAVLLLMD